MRGEFSTLNAIYPYQAEQIVLGTKTAITRASQHPCSGVPTPLSCREHSNTSDI